MSKLNIIYSKEFDTQRVVNTIKKIKWYVENNYNYKNFSFPKSLDKEKLDEYSEQEITDAVIVEYAEDSYKENEKILLDNWGKISKDIKSSFLKSGLLIQDEYKIYLTKYGTGGSYDLPNTVIINTTFKMNLLKNMIHEIIHLAIEKDINEYKIGQAQKERIVDLFFIKNFPRMVITQNVYSSIDTEQIDQTFDGKYPNILEVIKRISEIH
jgi:hypothetical protein